MISVFFPPRPDVAHKGVKTRMRVDTSVRYSRREGERTLGEGGMEGGREGGRGV